MHKPAADGASSEADALGMRLRDAAATLSPGAQRIARFIAANRAVALGASAATLAERTGTSDATVVRTVQALGFDGMAELKRALADTLAATPSTPAEGMRRTLAATGSNDVDTAIDHVLATQVEAVEALANAETRAKLRQAVIALHPARRIFVFGMGPTAALASYAAALLARTGRQSRALNAAGLALADQLLDLDAQDALLVLAYGKSYAEVRALFAEGKRLSIPIILLSDSLDRSLAKSAEVVVPARRGRARQFALHGATFVALEALVLGLASLNPDHTLASLDRLNDLRAIIAGGRQDVG